jgi:hypothetical protein
LRNESISFFRFFSILSGFALARLQPAATPSASQAQAGAPAMVESVGSVGSVDAVYIF